MKIIENPQFLNTMPTSAKRSTSSQFNNILSSNMKILKEQKTDLQDIEKFKKELTKLGASAFLAKLNEDKIEEKVAQKRAELIKTFGINDQTKADKKERLTKLIEDILKEYKKELMNSNRSNTLLERAQNLAASKNTGITLASLLSTTF